MAITTRSIDYSFGGKTFEGVLAIDDAKSGPLPAVLISHAWAGRTQMEVDFAKKVAGMGYAAFALDLYGKGVAGASAEENQKLMTPFLEDRAMLQSRMANAVEVVRGLSEVDAAKVAAIGFCFGGLCVLDLARAGGDVAGVASFHGLFSAPGNTKGKKITAKVIAFHGWDDPMVTPEDVTALGKELTESGADWQIHAYGGVMHAFTNKSANDPSFGAVYDAAADRRSWTALKDFLAECFG